MADAGSSLVGEDLLSLRPRVVWSAFRSEHFAFAFICLYLFLEYVKPEQQYPIFGILPFLMLSILGSTAGFIADRTSRIVLTSMHYWLLIFAFHCLISSLNAYRPQFALDHLEIIYFPIAVFFLITGIVNTEKRLFLFVLVFFLANFRMSQFGFLSWVRRGFSFQSYGVTGAGWFRNSGEFGMEMAMFFAYTICFAFFLKKYWTGWIKWLMYFIPVTAIACVMASSSRGAIVGIVAALFYLSMFSKKKIRAWLATALLGYFVYLMLPDEFLARFQTAGKDPTSLSRIYYWSKAHMMMDENPILGVGYYNWVTYFGDYYFDPALASRVELVHNTFLQVGAELGYVGLGMFIIMLLISFYINWRSERAARDPGFEFLRSFALGMNAAGMALVVSSMFLTAIYMPSFWIHFGLTICLRNAIEHKRRTLAELPVQRSG